MSESSNRVVRIGAVSYLNSKPLVEGLAEAVPHGQLVLDYPSRLADGLAAGLLDVALIPSIECFRHRDYQVVSDACVAARGPVRSVKLYSRVPMCEVRQLALDATSRTSAVLARILLAERFGLQPRIETLPTGSHTSQIAADAVLLIGDSAFHTLGETFHETWDLGEQWYQWSGLPFVFAMWVTRADRPLTHDVQAALCAARDRGLERLDAIARREARRLEIAETLAVEYLTENLHFQLAEPERRGLALFRELAVRWGLASGGIDLVFRDD